MIFLGLIYYKLNIRTPSIINHFEEETFRSNYQAFKNSIRYANLIFQTKGNQDCEVDCWIKGNVGLDYGKSGYPISTQFTTKNFFLNPSGYKDDLNGKDCAKIWSFLMGPMHQTINTEEGSYQSNYDKVSSFCIYTDKKVADFSILYDSKTGTIDLLEINQTIQ